MISTSFCFFAIPQDAVFLKPDYIQIFLRFVVLTDLPASRASSACSSFELVSVPEPASC